MTTLIGPFGALELPDSSGVFVGPFGALAYESGSPTSTYTYTGAGGSQSGGTASVIINWIFLAAGAAQSGGAAVTSFEAGATPEEYIYAASGGLQADGSGDIAVAWDIVAAGGAQEGGAAITSVSIAGATEYTYEAAGAVTTSGAADTDIIIPQSIYYMIYSYVNYVGDGVTQIHTVTFPFISRDHVTVYVDGASVPFTWLSDASVSITTAPGNGTDIKIDRDTPKGSKEVDYTNGSTLGEAAMDLSNDQLLYVAQEAFDGTSTTITEGADGQFDMGSRRLRNVADAVNGTDAVNKNQVNSLTLSMVQAAQAAQAAAENGATAASIAVTQAGIHETNAETAETNAETAETNAETAQAAAEAAAAAIRPHNLLINGNFRVNQRVFAGGALSAGVYGHDRWKAGSGGANYSESGGVVSLTSGSVVQVIENPHLATSVTLSAAVSSGTVTGKINATSGSLPLTVAVTDGDITIELSGDSSAFTDVQVEIGAVASGFEYRPFGEEVALCQQYLCKSYNLDVAPGTVTGNGLLNTRSVGVVGWMPVRYPVEMRSVPTITAYSPLTGASGKIKASGADVDGSAYSIGTGGCSLAADNNTANEDSISGHYVADAEL